ncbi:GIY-YIG nuclease family protein [Metabacillus indicus]|uniref:GIY-YIG nuclease family protein n=1 Tax=Metabacillus indicus TaxID=246786 RepID=UPI00068AE13D|nr:GIY-YIG nuclease family protein [Metabacillus indicus]
MPRKSEKTLSDLKLNIFQRTNNSISVTVRNPHEGTKFKFSSVEHTDQHHGNDMARTHVSLFDFFKDVLISNGKWKDIEAKLGKKRKLSDKVEIDFENRFGFIYLTTNLINGMKYVGKHSRNDGKYLGSGTELKAAIEEFGSENFSREEIAWAYTPDQLNELEKMYIDTFNAVKDPNFYNMSPGGNGWYDAEVKR